MGSHKTILRSFRERLGQSSSFELKCVGQNEQP
jgi:hypothetical protein